MESYTSAIVSANLTRVFDHYTYNNMAQSILYYCLLRTSYKAELQYVVWAIALPAYSLFINEGLAKVQIDIRKGSSSILNNETVYSIQSIDNV